MSQGCYRRAEESQHSRSSAVVLFFEEEEGCYTCCFFTAMEGRANETKRGGAANANLNASRLVAPLLRELLLLEISNLVWLSAVTLSSLLAASLQTSCTGCAHPCVPAMWHIVHCQSALALVCPPAQPGTTLFSTTHSQFNLRLGWSHASTIVLFNITLPPTHNTHPTSCNSHNSLAGLLTHCD